MVEETEKRFSVDLPGLDEDIKKEIENRVLEFEEKYQDLVFQCKDAVVPRVKNVDYLIAIVINAILVIYLVTVLIGGG